MKIIQLLIFIILTITSSYSNDLSKNDKEFYNLYKNLQWKEIKLSSFEKKWINQNHKIRVSLGSWPPYMFWENGIPQGMVVDYLKVISYKMNLNVEFIERKHSFEKAKSLLMEGKEIDLMPMITNNLERRPYISFTKDYIVQPWVIITKEDEDFIGSLDDLKGKSLAVTEGYFYIKILKEKYPEIKLISFKTDEDALKAVSSYKANGYIGVIPVSTYMFNKFNLLNLKIAASTNLPDDTNAIGIRKDWPELRSIIDKAFDAMKPEIHNFVKQNSLSVKYEYGISFKDIIKWLGIITIIFLLIVIAIIFVNKKLSNEIKQKEIVQKELEEKILENQIQKETLKKELEEKNKLLFIEEKFNRFFQLSINIQLIATIDGVIKQLNSAWENLLGYEDYELINTSFLDIVHPDDLEATINEMAKLSKNENVYYFENRFMHKDGYYINLAWSATIDHFNNLIYAAAQDITKLKKSEKENKEKEDILFQQSKMAAMGEMLGNIAHQWRQPLSIISTTATGAKVQNELGLLNKNNMNSYFDSINNTAQYLSQTIDDFRGFFNPQNSNVKEFNITDIINKSLNLVSAQFITKKIEVIQDIEEFKLEVVENELVQVLINILNNAKDALLKVKNQKRYIFINTYKNDSNCVIEIKDNGNGIPKDIINRVFEPYFTTKHQSQGTGIGLYMSEEIVQKHLGGTLTVSNETYLYEDIEYTGAKFTIKIDLD